MDAGFRTPLLDLFRRGEVDREIRLLAAQGAVAPRAHEQIGLLMLLVDDQDGDIAAAAEATIQSTPRAALATLLARSDTPEEIRRFFALRGIEPADAGSADPDAPLVETAPPGPEPAMPDGTAATGDDVETISALSRIAAMNVAQRIGVAMKGSREERAILIRDPNKIVAVAVLSSPKITGSEIEAIARMANVSEEVLRIIAHTRAWMKNYPVVVALAKNPKTPLALSMNLLPRLTDRDLRMLSSDRNVPDVLRITARKKVVF